MRAFSDNEDLALLSGINPERVVADHLADRGRASQRSPASFTGSTRAFKPFVYFQLLLPIFASAIVGGLGNADRRHRGRLT